MSPRKESELWKNPVFFQNPIGYRPDVYSAEDEQGGRVAVKGPFETQEKASVSLYVQQLKSEVDGLDLLEYQVNPALADRFPHERRRFSFALDVVRYFLVSEDLTAPHKLPVKKHSPTKYFEALQVVDFDVLASRSGYRGSVGPWIWRNQELAEKLVKHVLVNWVLGIGGDMAQRNFLVTSDARLYNVDTDSLGNMSFRLGNCQVCASGKRMGNGFTEFLWNYDLEPLRRDLRMLEWSLLPKESRAEAQRRSQLSLDELLHVLEPARDASPKRS